MSPGIVLDGSDGHISRVERPRQHHRGRLARGPGSSVGRQRRGVVVIGQDPHAIALARAGEAG